MEFEAGNVISADLWIPEAFNLKIQEATLTEKSEPFGNNSMPVEKENIPRIGHGNMIYMGTTIMYGRGVGVVVSIEMEMELVKTANLIDTVENSKIPLQGKLDKHR